MHDCWTDTTSKITFVDVHHERAMNIGMVSEHTPAMVPNKQVPGSSSLSHLR